jgi:hypothetical protein
MKKTINKSLSIVGLLLCLLSLPLKGSAQTHYTMWLANTSSTSTTMDMDVMFSVDSPVEGVKLSGLSAGINYNTSIVNGGTLSLSYVGGKTPIVASLVNSSLNAATAGHLRISSTPLVIGSAIDIPAGTYCLGRYRVTNTASWSSASNAQLWMQPVNTGGKTLCAVNSWIFGATSGTSSSYTVANSGLTLSYTQASPLTLMLNAQVCATSASQTTSNGVTCFGGSNGSSTITMSPTPTVSSITYTVDGGSSQSATLVGGSFTISGLSAGTHAVVISNAGCSNVTATGVSVNGPSQLTNTTSASACDSYTWSVTGQTYTTSGTYTGTTTNGSGCTVNETLNLTINHSSTSEETAVACDSYTWHGTTYTTSGDKTYTSTNASGCPSVTTLHLTINNSSTSEETQVACDSYTWHGTTYTTSGDKTYTSTNASGCPNVATLHLTINNNSTTEETLSACNSYTWHGTTYTASGDYTYEASNASGCQNVAILHLTINSDAITTQPTAPVICKLLGASATVSVVAANSSSPSYQWFSQASTATSGWTPLVNNVNYSGVTTSTLTITRTTTTVPPAGTKYRVEVSGSCSTANSSNVVALQDQTVLSKVTAPKVVTVLTPALTSCEGSNVVLSLAAGSIGNIQLQSSTDGISWNNSGSVVAQSAVSAVNAAMTFNTGALTQDTWFRFMASNGVCSSVVSSSVKITVSTTPDAGTISGGDVTVCTPVAAALNLSGATVAITNSTTLTLTGSSLGATILWQKSINYLAATPTWAVAGSTTTSLTVSNLAASTWYRAKITNGACVVYTDVVKITVTPTAKAGAISSATSVCSGGDIAFTSAAYVGSSIAWEVSTTSATAGFSTVAGENGLVFNMNSVAYAPLSKFYVRTVVTSGDCTIARSAVKTILVNPTSVAGTVTGGGTVCNSGLAGTLKLAGNTGTIQWQYSTDGVNYTNAPKATAGTAPTFTTTSASSIAATYVVSNVTSDTYFRALVTSGACSSAVSNAVQYVVGTAAVAGTATAASNEVCPTFGTTITLAGSTGSIAWKKSTNWTAATPTWAAVTTSVSPTLSTGALAASTAYKAVVTIGGCSTVESNVVVVIVTAKPVSKGITANVTSPAGAAATPLCTSSTSKVLSVTAGYVGNIQWQSSTTSTTAGFADISGATATTYTISGAIEGANYFRVRFTNSCGAEVFSPALTIYYKDCTPPAKTAAPFGVVVYPNPSSENFNFNLSTSSEEKVSVVVYDMTGKLVDSREVAPTEVSELQLGDRYPSGVYNMIVTQGDNTKTLRVIKR